MELLEAIARACEVSPSAVTDLRPASGGDISRAHTARVADRRVFVKTLQPPVPGLLAAEAAGLDWLAAPDVVRTPRVLGVLEEDLPLLVLEHLGSTRPARDHDEWLGRGLARLHLAGSESFGSPWPSFIGSLRRPRDLAEAGTDQTGTDTGMSSAADFLARCRWWPVARTAAERGALPDGTLDALAALIDVLPDRLGHDEPPARVHGDLWAGNAITDEHGHPVLIDPSAHGGLREADLAMMRLFGGFAPAVFAAYDEVHPLPDGHTDRVALHQLHPLLVHAALFGGGYGRRARDVIDRCT